MIHQLKYKFYSSLTLLFLSFNIYAQNIESINITGAREFLISNYIDWSGIKLGAKYFPEIIDSMKSRIASNLSNKGFYNFHFISDSVSISSDSLSANIIINIQEGEPTYIYDLHFQNIDPPDSIEITNNFNFLIGNVLIKDELVEAFSKSINYFENNGFPFTKIIITSISFFHDTTEDKNLADIFLQIEKGLSSRIDSVEIVGNTKTKDYVIVQNIRLRKGEDYSQNRIEEIPKQLNRLKFFEPVEMPSFYFDPSNRGILQIKIKEKETNNFDGIIGYVPGQNNETGYITGYVNVSLRNLFGTGRAAAIRWQQENRFTQEMEIKYLEPWALGYPFNLNFGLFQRKQDSTYVQRSFDGSLEFLATESISASLLISSESIIPTESESDMFIVYNSSALSTGANLKIDTRDDFYAPTSGIYFLNSYKYTSKKINGPAEFVNSETKTKIILQRLELDLSIFYEIFSRQIAAFSVHAREMKGELFEVSDLYKLGGANTLRGYREKQFLGNRILWSNLEYRYLVSRRSFLFAFFDTGYYLRNEDKLQGIEKLTGLKTGYGIGMNIETSLGVMSVSYALGQGDSMNEGKLHFGLLNEF
ncbi:MAG: BamA/TamA family outer membrane protein [bacterium]